MPRWRVLVALSICILISLPLVAAAEVSEGEKVFSLPEQNGTVILGSGVSYSKTGVSYDVRNYSAGQLYSWFFPMFSTGNGTANLRVAAQNCNVTVTSYRSQRTPIGGDLYNRTSMLNCTVSGAGIVNLDYIMGENASLQVYFDGALRGQGDGWNSTDFGITISGSVSELAIYAEQTSFEPPRSSPHTESLVFIGYVGAILGIIIAVLAIVGLRALKQHRHKPLSIGSS